MTCFYFPIGMLGEWQKWAVAVFAVGKKVLLQSQWEELELAGSEILSSNGDEDHGDKMEMFPQEITFSFKSDHDQHGKDLWIYGFFPLHLIYYEL